MPIIAMTSLRSATSNCPSDPFVMEGISLQCIRLDCVSVPVEVSVPRKVKLEVIQCKEEKHFHRAAKACLSTSEVS